MVNKNVSMPHPVLGIPQDMEGGFEVEFEISINRKKREYEFLINNFKISNDYINSLVTAGSIDQIIKISCPPTYKCWTFRNSTSISLPENEVDSHLDIELFLIATKPIVKFSDPSFNPIFLNSTFQLSVGDIVGMAGSKRVPISKENEKVSLGSIFKFSRIKSSEKIQELNFSFDDDQINIYYPASDTGFDPVHFMFDQSKGAPYIAVNLYLLPALTEAFNILEGDEAEIYNLKRWAVIIASLLPNEMRSSDSFINAQRLISSGLPTNLAFQEFLKIKNSKND